jgi:hypothetical protein
MFPCRRDKTPLTPHGFKDASNDPAQVFAWWGSLEPEALGLATGAASGLWVLDVDAPEPGRNGDGPSALASLEQEHGSLPATVEQVTGGGGRHLFFAWPGDELPVKNSAGKLAPGLDVRGDGGYVILPPSLHYTGNRYAWAEGRALGEMEPAQAPAWLLALARGERDDPPPLPPISPPGGQGATSYGRRTLADELAELTGAALGERNACLNKAAFRLGRLVAGGQLERSQVEAALLGAALGVGLTEREARATIRSGLEAGLKEPRGPGSEEAYLPPRLLAVDLADFLAHDFPPRGQVLAPVIPEQGLSMMFAARGTGKTYAALSMAHAVASGGMAFRWQAPRPRRVLYLDGEMPGAAMQERLARIVAGVEGEAPEGHFKLLTPDLAPNSLMPNLATLEGQAMLEPLLEGVGLVVVDNLACLARAGRENEAEGWLPVQGWLLAQRRAGRSVLLVHHAGKGGDQRGTSAREDVLDVVIRLGRPQDYEPSQGARFIVELTKARGITGPEADPFEATLNETPTGGLNWATRDVADLRLEQVRELKGLGMSTREIAEETGIPRSTVARLAKKVEAAS